MKKISILLAAILTAIPLSACSGNAGGSPATTAAGTVSSTTANEPAETDSEAASAMDENAENQEEQDILVAYFTRSNNVDQEPGVDAVSRASFNVEGDQVYGNTELLAQYIEEAAGGDMFSIMTAEPYPYDVDETIDLINEQGDHRSELTTHVENMEDYDVVFIGFPIWYATMPEPVISFLNEYDFSGKTIIPFSTHRGSRFGSSIGDLQEMLPEATILDGFTVDGDSAVNARQDVQNWLSDIGMNK